MSDLYASLYDVSAWILPLMFAITLHEAAHGWMASKLGDETALRMGRVTFNPLRHVDRFGTIILPGLLMLAHAPFLFGYAKPVPVNFAALHHPRRDMALVAFAGPGINLLLAYAGALALHVESFLTPEQAPWLFMNLYRWIQINIVLALFNLLPLLPLDGGRILYAALPRAGQRVFGRMERWGILLVLTLLMLPSLLNLDFSIIGLLLEKPFELMIQVIMSLAGIGGGYH